MKTALSKSNEMEDLEGNWKMFEWKWWDAVKGREKKQRDENF